MNNCHTKIIVSIISIGIFGMSLFLLFDYDGEKNDFSRFDLEYYPINDICDLSCKEQLEEQEFTCVEIELNSYACREKIVPSNETVVFTYVIPPEFGEYYFLKPDMEVKLASIVQVSLYSDAFIQILLENEFGLNDIKIERGQSFTSLCLYDNLHVWTFTDIVIIQGETYIEMYKRLAKIPETFDCNDPVLIL